jgi:cytoskeletal protein RodZ
MRRIANGFKARTVMMLLLLEALGALVLLVFIVWWTMFSGRKKGELPTEDDQASAADKAQSPNPPPNPPPKQP